ncbi:MAG: hypothetical protein ABH890_03640 [Bacillota bacterium]
MIGEILISILLGIIGPVFTTFATIMLITIIGQLLKDNIEKGLYSNAKIFIILTNIIMFFTLMSNSTKGEGGTINIVLITVTWAISLFVVIKKLSKKED